MNTDTQQETEKVARRLEHISHVILVLSGKGGVGKSTVAVNIAAELARRGKRVGLLDIDIHGPSIPGMLGLGGHKLDSDGSSILPVRFNENLSVVSVGFMIEDISDAVIWRGPLKFSVIRQFLADVDWGDHLDYLIVDCPPGTGDEPLSVAQLVGKGASAVVVTTPQKVSIDDVRRSITFCRKLDLDICGIVENMSGFICPQCGETIDIFATGGGADLALEMDVPFIGAIPVDTSIAGACDDGVPFIDRYGDNPCAEVFRSIVDVLTNGGNSDENNAQDVTVQKERTRTMKIAIPLAQGELSPHFGHCETFVLIDMDDKGEILSKEELTPPPHEPGVLPNWLHEQGATHIISGGMGMRAQELFAASGIQVVVGASRGKPDEIARAFVEGTLVTSGNICDH